MPERNKAEGMRRATGARRPEPTGIVAGAGGKRMDSPCTQEAVWPPRPPQTPAGGA